MVAHKPLEDIWLVGLMKCEFTEGHRASFKELASVPARLSAGNFTVSAGVEFLVD
ncbi:hypothetical protein DAPPUDRAFT_246859 [Daphnia pulex]|uniref:Uncharacterized protein n=1 Tax=Daphnia pulex TaxID=6669 RepID=E9GRC1_DAPPU|nr:hypothetical protein DAPPUDRAFT_246859 [Daphnia pulex]|eukprot:EFX77987.1 hypothetical protein DAPPUDRAFT_246859 [Daphnia pulex]